MTISNYTKETTHWHKETMSYQSNNGGNMTESADNHSRPGNSASFGIPPDTIPAVVIMVFVLVINSSVILLISCYSCLRTTSNIILASLAVSDFLVGFVGIPLLVTCSSALHLTSVCTSSIIFFTFMALSTVLHITVMTCDRYIYIMWALRYPEIVRRSRVFLVLAITWIISLGQSLVRLSWTWNVSVATAVEDLALVREKETIYFLFNIIVFFLIPLIVMIVLDARMLLLLRKQCQKIARENLPAEFVRREKKLQRRQRRAVLTCVLLLILYVIFWLPYFILELVQQHNTGKLPNLVIITIYYLRLCTSLFNPLTYTLRKYDLRSRVKNIFQRMFFSWRKDETGMEYTRGTNLSHGPVASV